MSSDPTQPQAPQRGNFLTWAALVVAVGTATGSVLFSLPPLNYIACPLCFYQRTFAFAVVGVYVVGLIAGLNQRAALSLLALPLAAGGAAVAGFHVWLIENGTLECPPGFLGYSTVPHQALAAFALLLFVQLCDLLMRLSSGREWLAVLVSLVVGAGLAGAGLVSAPKLPDPPKKAYEKEVPDICRRPYRP
jgi:disulfide bond formation protein DsbB